MAVTQFTPQTLTELAFRVPRNRRPQAQRIASSIALALAHEEQFRLGMAYALATFAGGDAAGTLTIGEIAALPLGAPGCPQCGGWIFENADEDRRYCSRDESHEVEGRVA